jgi:Zn finger protein HypA/HybF involved in hydrogenase expression
MITEELEKNWQKMSQEIMTGVAEWRMQHPQATFREIEAEIDRRLAGFRAKMISDVAMQSKKAEWEASEVEVYCEKCGEKLKSRGRKKRKLETNYGQEIEIEREYGVCPKCRQGIFPPG